eukprot:1402041-Pyramimonas_sp.AAC.2
MLKLLRRDTTPSADDGGLEKVNRYKLARLCALVESKAHRRENWASLQCQDLLSDASATCLV